MLALGTVCQSPASITQTLKWLETAHASSSLTLRAPPGQEGALLLVVAGGRAQGPCRHTHTSPVITPREQDAMRVTPTFRFPRVAQSRSRGEGGGAGRWGAGVQGCGGTEGGSTASVCSQSHVCFCKVGAAMSSLAFPDLVFCIFSILFVIHLTKGLSVNLLIFPRNCLWFLWFSSASLVAPLVFITSFSGFGFSSLFSRGCLLFTP